MKKAKRSFLGKKHRKTEPDSAPKTGLAASISRAGTKALMTGRKMKRHGKRIRTVYKIVNALGKYL